MRAKVVNKGQPEDKRLAMAKGREEDGFVERIVVAQVEVHNLIGKEDPDLVTLGYRFYLTS